MDTKFGSMISELRKNAKMSQRELASMLLKEDGEAISGQYLNDIEHGRRNPPSETIIRQMAKIFNLNPDVLLLAAGTVPKDIQERAFTQPEVVREALLAFRKSQKK